MYECRYKYVYKFDIYLGGTLIDKAQAKASCALRRFIEAHYAHGLQPRPTPMPYTHALRPYPTTILYAQEAHIPNAHAST